MLVNRISWQLEDEVGCWPKPNDMAIEQRAFPLRRRLSPLGRMAIDTLAMAVADIEQADIPWVVSCRHGDISRMLNLLKSLSEKEILSPTDFSMSVHNAIAGVHSIASSNKRMNTVLSGSKKSFEAGLLEAYALQKDTQETVGYLYYDFPLPELYEEEFAEDNCQKACIAMVLSSKSCKKDEENTIIKDVVNLSYIPGDSAGPTQMSINALVELFKTNEKSSRVPVPGGSLLLERVFNQS